MLVLVGKTCSGKNTVRDILVERYDMEPVLTYTTRPKRDGEENYVDYIFVKPKHFQILKEEDWFAETTSYNVSTGDTWHYGSVLTDYANDSNKVIILNPSGLKQIRKLNIPVFAIYLFVNDSEIKQRSEKRGFSPDDIQRRLRADNEDFADIDEYVDGSFINMGDPELIAKEIYRVYQYYLEKKKIWL